MALCRFPPALNDFAYGCLHPLPDPGRLSRAVQDHGNIGFCHAKFRSQISVGNVLVVHLANETACPLFRQKYHPFLFGLLTAAGKFGILLIALCGNPFEEVAF